MTPQNIKKHPKYPLQYHLFEQNRPIKPLLYKATVKDEFEAYNQERFHQALGYKTPDEVYEFAQAA